MTDSQSDTATADTTAEDEEAKKKKIIAIVVAAVVALAIIVGVIVALATGDSDDEETTEETTESTTVEEEEDETTTYYAAATTTEEATTTTTTTVKTYNVYVDVDGNGSVSGEGSYEYGEKAVLVATADDGYEFDGWYNNSGSLVASGTTYSVTVKDEVNLTAKFVAVSSAED